MKCNSCKSKLNRKFKFWINPADAIGGGLVFTFIFLVFIGIISLVVETTRVSLIPAFNAAEIEASSWLDFLGEFLDVTFSVGIFLYFLVLGGAKFSKYFSYLFDFRFETYKECSSCGDKSSVTKLPLEPKS